MNYLPTIFEFPTKPTIEMSATKFNPMILSGDCIMYESEDLFAAPTTPSSMQKAYNEDVSKKHNIELSSTLPEEESSAPFSIHSSVLDSVFSSVLDEHADFQDHTPMFDELDLIMDGSKVNLKEDWVSLFGKSEPLLTLGEEGEELDTLLEETVAPASVESNVESSPQSPVQSFKRPYSEVEESFEFAPKQNQLFTPNPSLTLSTPMLDGVSTKKIDHLGCVTYSKKQRTQPLQPIKLDACDPVLMKRAKNTEAARRSRARKMERMSQLEDKVEGLIQDKEDLALEVTRLRKLLLANGIDY